MRARTGTYIVGLMVVIAAALGVVPERGLRAELFALLAFVLLASVANVSSRRREALTITQQSG